jgi:hypothetical protein
MREIFANWWTCGILFVISAFCFSYLVPRTKAPIFKNSPYGAKKILDEYIMTWRSEIAKEFYGAIGSEGRRAYQNYYWKLDFWLPGLVTSLLYISLLSLAFQSDSLNTWIILFPFLAWLFDVAENINHFMMARSYPQLSQFSLRVGPTFTFLKWLLVMVIPIIAIVGFVIQVF